MSMMKSPCEVSTLQGLSKFISFEFNTGTSRIHTV
jgi:hypothetical protein